MSQGSVLRHFVYIFMFNNVCTYIGNTIFTSEMIETIPVVEKMIVGKDGVIHRAKITALRIGIWGFMVFISGYSTNIIDVLNFTGSGFTPIVSYFGPVRLNLRSRFTTATRTHGRARGSYLNGGKYMMQFISLSLLFIVLGVSLISSANIL